MGIAVKGYAVRSNRDDCIDFGNRQLSCPVARTKTFVPGKTRTYASRVSIGVDSTEVDIAQDSGTGAVGCTASNICAVKCEVNGLVGHRR